MTKKRAAPGDAPAGSLPEEPFFTLTPLGGLGEIGLNCQMWSTPGSLVVVDCGLMFPEDYHLGVDVVIPRFDVIVQNRDRLQGIVLTHGHEDHIGALPWLVPQISAPIYGSPLTLALVEHKLRERNLLDRVTLIPISPEKPLKLGDMKFRFFPVSHSIVDGLALAVETPVGKVIHTGDFKIDPAPIIGPATDLAQFRSFAGRDGVRLLLSDSTNVETPGRSRIEREVVESFERIFRDAPGRIIVTLFSSNIQRIHEVFSTARQFGRKVVVSGRSLGNNIEIARNLGFLPPDAVPLSDSSSLAELPDNQTVLLLTGSQGEPLSALARITSGAHRQLSIHKGDTVLMSSRFIPGNARAIWKIINQLFRLGAEVLYDSSAAIHASGHGYRDELAAMIKTVKPAFFLPVHGEYRHLVKHARLAQECGVAPERALVLENGQPVTLLRQGMRLEEPVAAESILVDGKGVGDVGQSLLRERQILGDEGIVIVMLAIDAKTREVLYGPEMISRGFVFEPQFSHVLEDSKCLVLDVLEEMQSADIERLQDKIRSSLRRFFRTVLERDPLVVPVITQLDM